MLITGKTKIVGIFGHPVEQTMSPYMHNSAFKALGLPYCYLPFDIKPKDLEVCVRSIIPLGIKGVNITIPFKTQVIPYLDEIDKDSEQIGAVNTIEVKDERLIGHNTDGKGFINAFKEEIGITLSKRRFVVIGAGGAARAVSFALAKEEAGEIIILNRTLSKGKKLADDLLHNFNDLKVSVLGLDPDKISKIIKDGDAIINATSIGMRRSDPAIISPDILRPSIVVCDLIYNPSETPLLTIAKSVGARSMNGLGMLLHQGALSFEIWTGLKAPADIMKVALMKVDKSF